MEILPSSFLWTALAVTAVAAVSDARSGRIPNWLTLPPIVLAPIGYAASDSSDAALWSIGAALLCALVPYGMFRHGAMGGGDVKLFSALGALTGKNVGLGLEIQLCSFVLAVLLSVFGLAWEGRLLRTLKGALLLVLNPVVPSNRRRAPSPELMTPVRMGVPILLATAARVLPELANLRVPTP